MPGRSSSPSPAAAARVPGSGLGLAIARGLAVANGGDVHLSADTPGGGSTFVLELPAAGASGP
jgi:two-component system sensor histidine kinase KdpD